MRKLIQKLKENNLILDTVNVILGVVMILAIIAVFVWQSVIALFITVWSAGLMNTVNGLKLLMKKEKKMMGQSMVFMGVLIIVAGTVLLLSAGQQ
ncbi:MAG: hypothetical protein IJY09_00525 [Lachnospiraceae bacterium]|nr:hypothetical protein [Lachnospiraceae bacterium]